MANAEAVARGLKLRKNAGGEAKEYVITGDDLYYLGHLLVTCVKAGALVSVGTSSDGGALGVTIISGKSKKRYWTGASESFQETIMQIESDWELDYGPNPIDEVIQSEVQKQLAEVEATRRNG